MKSFITANPNGYLFLKEILFANGFKSIHSGLVFSLLFKKINKIM
mgnify:CR=1 FL=1